MEPVFWTLATQVVVRFAHAAGLEASTLPGGRGQMTAAQRRTELVVSPCCLYRDRPWDRSGGKVLGAWCHHGREEAGISR